MGQDIGKTKKLNNNDNKKLLIPNLCLSKLNNTLDLKSDLNAS